MRGRRRRCRSRRDQPAPRALVVSRWPSRQPRRRGSRGDPPADELWHATTPRCLSSRATRARVPGRARRADAPLRRRSARVGARQGAFPARRCSVAAPGTAAAAARDAAAANARGGHPDARRTPLNHARSRGRARANELGDGSSTAFVRCSRRRSAQARARRHRGRRRGGRSERAMRRAADHRYRRAASRGRTAAARLYRRLVTLVKRTGEALHLDPRRGRRARPRRRAAPVLVRRLARGVRYR